MDTPREALPAVGRHGTSEAVLGAALARACDQLMRGILLLDGAWRMLYANLAAREMLAEGDVLHLDGDRISVRDARQHGRLREYVERSSQLIDSETTSNLAMQLDRPSGLPAYRLLVTRLVLSPALTTDAVFLIMVFDPSTSRRIRAEVIVELYGLTRAEAAIAVQLFEGSGVSEIAANTCHSANTIRTHVRAIFRKCQVSSQAQLLQLLALGPRR